MSGRLLRRVLAIAAGLFIWAFCAANLGEIGAIVGAVFGLAGAYLSYEYLTRRAEADLTREKAKDYE